MLTNVFSMTTVTLVFLDGKNSNNLTRVLLSINNLDPTPCTWTGESLTEGLACEV